MVSGEASELPPLTAAVLIEGIRAAFRRLTDVRKGGNNQRYTLEDAGLSAFAAFVTQSPSPFPFLGSAVRLHARGPETRSAQDREATKHEITTNLELLGNSREALDGVLPGETDRVLLLSALALTDQCLDLIEE